MNDPMMIPCDHVIAKLWEYIDGELTPEHAAQVQAHLEICNRCFPQYDFQRAYKEFVRRSVQQAIPPDLRRRVFEMILAEEAGNGPASTLPTPRQTAGAGGILAGLRSLLDQIFHRR